MKSVYRIFVVLFIFAFVLSACGGTAPAKTFKAEDFKPATLGAADFPEGFQMLSQDEALAMGFDISTFEGSLSAFTSAKPVNTIVAVNSNIDAFQFAVAFVLAPMTQDEVGAFDKELNDPEKAKTEFAQGLGGEATFLAGADKIGDKSIGFDLTIASEGLTLRGELVIVRRGVALQMVILLWLDGGVKEVNAVDLAKKLDAKLADIQK